MANPQLSYAELKGVWLDASKGTRYHTNGWASLMAAIAEAESSGHPLDTNPADNNGTQTSWGLWQISNGTHSEPATNWADPHENAKLAIQKLDTQGLSAWGTYDSGAYKAFLSDKTAAAASTAAAVDSVTQAYATSAAKATASCLYGFGGVDPSIFGYHPFGAVGGFCILSRPQARAIVGAGLLLAGAIGIAGSVMLIVAATQSQALMKLAGPLGAVVSKIPAARAGMALAA